jgi:hypothetical protein
MHVIVVVIEPQELVQFNIVLYRQERLLMMQVLQAELLSQLAFDKFSLVSIVAHPLCWQHGRFYLLGSLTA